MSHQGHHESHTHRTSSCGPAVGGAGCSDGEIVLPRSCMKSSREIEGAQGHCGKDALS